MNECSGTKPIFAPVLSVLLGERQKPRRRLYTQMDKEDTTRL
jgi:hypothetical protein